MNDVGDEPIPENVIAQARGKKRAGRETVAVSIPERVDVAGIRRKLNMSQEVFALRYGFSVKNIRNWEQGVRQPESSARAYLLVIERAPQAVQAALQARNAERQTTLMRRVANKRRNVLRELAK